jgi:hypothetical protein
LTIGATPASIVNQALAQIAAQATVTGNNPTFDGSAAGNAAGELYTSCVNLLLRQQDYEFSRVQASMVQAGIAPNYPWQYIYLYPPDCLKIRQVIPEPWNQNDPQPVRWSVETVVISSTKTTAILSNAPPAQAVLVYTSSIVTESQFDPVFQETLVRLLASELVMALGGRPDFSDKKLMESGNLVTIGSGFDS